MKIKIKNIFDELPKTISISEEFFETVAESDSVRIERIISDGHTTPENEWYDQKLNEWVLLISGSATLQFQGNDEEIILKPGDSIMIPSGCRHRVEKTDNIHQTIWLAVHFQ